MNPPRGPSSSPDVLVGGRYRLMEQIGAGGMGTVWTARDERLGRTIAVKVLHGTLHGDATMRERFRREAIAAGKVNHPSIAGVYDYVEEGDRRAIIMEFVDGETLAARIARGPLPAGEAAGIFAEVLSALQAAHELGVLHRDVKPSNILLTGDGRVKVTDFGVASLMGESTLTMAGSFMATPQYAAPEQLRGETSTPATDVYQTGVALYETLTGRLPFRGDTPVASALARLTQDPDPLPGGGAAAAAAMHALEREPADRFSSAQLMRAALAGDATVLMGALPGDAANDATVLMGALPGDETVVLGTAPPAGAAGATATPVRPHRARGMLIRAALIALIIGLVAAGLAAALSGPGTVAVPTLTNRSVADATRAARELGLGVTARTGTRPGVGQGIVFAQDPAPGATAATGTTITLTVADGCCTVPSLTSLDDAKETLEAANLALGRVTSRETNDAEPGTVLSQDPPAGRSVAKGTPVALVVAKEPSRGEGKGKNGKDD